MQLRKKGQYIHVWVNEEEKLTFSLGNRKLSTRVLIFSLPAGRNGSCCTTCPGCYALKTERIYPAARRAREVNFQIVKRDPELLIEAVRQIDQRYGAYFDAFRIHEGGDIFSQAYADALSNAGAYLRAHGKTAYTYTKSIFRPEHVNVVESVLPGGEYNFAPLETIKDRARQYGAPICPATLPGNDHIICGRNCHICHNHKHVCFVQH